MPCKFVHVFVAGSRKNLAHLSFLNGGFGGGVGGSPGGVPAETGAGGSPGGVPAETEAGGSPGGVPVETRGCTIITVQLLVDGNLGGPVILHEPCSPFEWMDDYWMIIAWSTVRI